MFLIANKLVKRKYGKYSRLLLSLRWVGRHTAHNCNTEFNDNLTNGLLAATGSQTDGQTGFCFVNAAYDWAAAG
jgi:hypothetical protein